MPLSDAHPPVEPASGYGAAASSAKSRAVVRAVVEFWLGCGTRTFVVQSDGATDATSVVLAELAPASSTTLTVPVPVPRGYVVPVKLFSDMGGGQSVVLAGATHPSKMRMGRYFAARASALFCFALAAAGESPTADDAEAIALRSAGIYTAEHAAESMAVAYERLLPEDKLFWDAEAAKVPETPPEDIQRLLANRHQRFASTGRVFGSTDEADEAVEYFRERVVGERGALGTELRKRLSFSVHPLGAYRAIVRTHWSEGPRGGTVLPNVYKKFVIDIFTAWGDGSTTAGACVSLLAEVATLARGAQRAAFAAAGFDDADFAAALKGVGARCAAAASAPEHVRAAARAAAAAAIKGLAPGVSASGRALYAALHTAKKVKGLSREDALNVATLAACEAGGAEGGDLVATRCAAGARVLPAALAAARAAAAVVLAGLPPGARARRAAFEAALAAAKARGASDDAALSAATLAACEAGGAKGGPAGGAATALLAAWARPPTGVCSLCGRPGEEHGNATSCARAAALAAMFGSG